MPNIRIPGRFLDDHMERDLPTPHHTPVSGGYIVDTDDAYFAELVDDARHYAHINGPDAAPPGLKGAATALLKAIARETAKTAALQPDVAL